jgi:CMP/dCMP kinase
MIIAVDGPSASGKGTIARAIAKKLGYHFLDTGSLYRMVGLSMLRQGLSLSDEASAAQIASTLKPELFEDGDLRNEWVATAASKVSALPHVRANLLQFQRSFAARKPGAVLDGRDIGTVIWPDAEVKLYITASPEIRAERRFRELQEQGSEATLDDVLRDVVERDQRDASRATAPLLPAKDAIVIDTSAMTREAALAEAMRHIRGK